ncbi:hypothetical protein [Halostella salina]|uniref:hypothetical protein n=1 Tax=Halostella salina TaxID=1547897 RepID=UPI000EF77583|nr:hypothetical protein [Halostella salina]
MSVSVSELGSADGGDVADITLEDGRELQASVRDVMPDDGVMVLESPVVDDVMEFRSGFDAHKLWRGHAPADGELMGDVSDVSIISTGVGHEDVFEVMSRVEVGDEVDVKSVVGNIHGDEDAVDVDVDLRREFRGEVESVDEMGNADVEMVTISIDVEGFEYLGVNQRHMKKSGVYHPAYMTADPVGTEYQLQGDVDWVERA